MRSTSKKSRGDGPEVRVESKPDCKSSGVSRLENIKNDQSKSLGLT